MDHQDLLDRLDSIQGCLSENGENESAEAIRDAMLVVREARDRQNKVGEMKGIPTGKSDKCWLIRTSEALNGQGIAPPISNPWYQSAFREIEKLEDAVQTLMNQNNTLNDGIKVLKDQATDYSKEVADLNAKLLFPSWDEAMKPTREEMEAEVKKLKEEIKLHAEAHNIERETLQAEVKHFKDLNFKLSCNSWTEAMKPTREEMDAEVKKLNEEVKALRGNGDNEKVYLRGRIKHLLHQVSSLSGILADVSGKHAERINTGIPTPVHLMNR